MAPRRSIRAITVSFYGTTPAIGLWDAPTGTLRQADGVGRLAGEREVIPLFPLGMVLVPGLALPLQIFEPRYRELISDLQAKPAADQFFGVIAIREGWEVGAQGVKALHDVGTSAALHEVRLHRDGRSEIVTVGVLRFKLIRLVAAGTPYLQGEVEWLSEADGDAAEVLAAAVTRSFADYRQAVAAAGASEAELMHDLPGDPRQLSYLVAVAAVLDLSDQQRLLAATETSDRLREELALLRREIALLRALPSLPAIELARTGFTMN